MSNALMRGLDQDESMVTSFLSGAVDKYSGSDELLEATVTEFGFDRATLDAQVQEFLHCNCTHGEVVDPELDTKIAPEVPEAAEATATTTGGQAGTESAGLRTILYVIASLVLLLLVVNASTLVVLIKQSKAQRGWRPSLRR